MINSVQNLSFRGDMAGAQDLINSPGKFTVPAKTAELPSDSFEMEGSKNKKTGVKALIGTLAVALAAFAGLGYAVKSGKFKKVDINESDNFFKKLWPQTKNLAHKVGEAAEKCWNTVAGWFGKGGKKAADTAANATENAAK